jgi:hypothetical protein
MPVKVSPDVEPTSGDIEQIIDGLKQSWKAAITVRRQSKADIGYRDIYISLDDQELGILHAGDELTTDVEPGPHRLKANNTLFKKTLDFTITVGEHAHFTAINRAGFGTYSVFAFFIGGGPIYLTLERDAAPAKPEGHQ